MLLVLTAVLWALPMVVAHSPLLGWIVGQVTGDLNGKASIESASLGWFSPVGVAGVQVHDPQGKLVIELPELSGDTSLLNLALNSKKLGKFTLERPTINVVLRPDGSSNVEELIANYLTGPSGEPVAVALEVHDATIHIEDQVAQQTWSIEKFNLALSMSDESDGPMTLAASGNVPGSGTQAGNFSVKLQSGKENQLRLETAGLQLARLNGLLARFAPGTRLAGLLNGKVECICKNASPESETPTVQVAADLTVDGLDVSAPQLGNDRLHLASLKTDCRLGYSQAAIKIEKANLESDIAQASFQGSVSLAGRDSREMLDALLRQAFALSANVDLARAAAMLPGTLHIDQQTRITSGRLKVELANRPGEQGAMACRGKIETEDLKAVYRGQPIEWQQPLVVSLDARGTEAGPVIDLFDCQSSFLTMQAAGSRQNLTVSLQFDLDRLTQQLAGFVDLGGLQLSGKGWANFDYRQTASDTFRADTGVQLRDLAILLPDRPPWHEPSLVILFSAAGSDPLGANRRIDSAKLEIKAGGEQIIARLAEPVANLETAGRWPLSIEGHGDLAAWTARANAWNLLTGWNAAGSYRVSANMVGSTSNLDVRDFQLAVDQLKLTGGGLNLDEPALRINMAGQYDRAKQNLSLQQAKLESSALGLDASEVSIAMPTDGPMELAGNVAYRGDLARLQSWITPAGAPPTWQIAGQFQGQCQLKQVGPTTAGNLDTTITNVWFQMADSQPFQESQVQLVVAGNYDRTSQLLNLEEFHLATSAAGIRMAGQAKSLGQNTQLNVAGQLGYDWQRVMPLLRLYLGANVMIVGRGSRPIQWQGPLDPATAQATAGIDWSAATAYGFHVGPGALNMHLANGIVQCDPIDMAVSEGRLTARPVVRFVKVKPRLELEPGPLVRQVRINPEMCAQGMQYIAPVLAGVATAEGRFSIDLDECLIRLDLPEKSKVAGRLTVHSVEVGPGFLVQELAVVLNRASPARLQRESVIKFQMKKGRVYHEGLELIFPELTVRTHGSVGLDQTLALVAEMPIPPKWYAGQQLLDEALRDQKIQVPIRGTLSKPQIDHGKLDEYNRQLFRKATQNMLQGELNRQLDRLLPPGR